MPSKSPTRDSTVALFARFSGQQNNLSIPRPYIDLCNGDHLQALLLSQIVYWSDRTKDAEGWFAKSYEDWNTELAMTEKQIRRAINGDPRNKKQPTTLGDLGVETEVRRSVHYGGGATLHYRINKVKFEGAILTFIGETKVTNGKVDTAQWSGTDPYQRSETHPSQSAGTYTETIAETTAEITNKEFSPAVEISKSQTPETSVSPSAAGEETSDPTPFQEEVVSNVGAEQATTPDVVTPPSPAPRKKNALQEAVAYALNLRPGGHAGKIGQMLTHADGIKGAWALKLDDGPMTHAEICAWGEWLRDKHGVDYDQFVPQKAQSMVDGANLFRADKSYEMWLRKGETRLGVLMGVVRLELVPLPGQFITVADCSESNEPVDLDKEIDDLWDYFNKESKNPPKDQAYFEAQRAVIAEQRRAYR